MTKQKRETLQHKMIKILRDGKPHAIDEFHELCRPSSRGAVLVHMVGIRKRHLKPNETVVAVIRNRRVHYQLFIRYDPSLNNSDS